MTPDAFEELMLRAIAQESLPGTSTPRPRSAWIIHR